MGTRSTTIIYDGKNEVCRIYRQFDGYPSGHGLDLARLCNVQIVNGFSGSMKAGTEANGMGCLAAQVVQGLKAAAGIGGIYLEPTGGPINDWCDYAYFVRGKEGTVPTIECRCDDSIVFDSTPADQITDQFVSQLETT